MKKSYKRQYIRILVQAFALAIAFSIFFIWAKRYPDVAQTVGLSDAVDPSVFDVDGIRRIASRDDGIIPVGELIKDDADFKYLCASGPYTTEVRLGSFVADKGFDKQELHNAHKKNVIYSPFGAQSSSYLFVKTGEKISILKLHENRICSLQEHEAFCLFSLQDTIELRGCS